jgi:hypothetical protein
MSITWHGQMSAQHRAAISPCSRKDEIVPKVVRLQLCTSPRTCSAPDGSGSLSPVVLAEEDLDATTRGLDGVGVRAGVRIDVVFAVVDRAVRVTL